MNHFEQPDIETEVNQDVEEEPLPRRLLILRIIGIVLLILAVLLGVYGSVAYIAWQRGQTERVENVRKAMNAELENQMSLAGGDVDAGNFNLALRRLDWILANSPDYPGAEELKNAAEDGLEARLTPTAKPTPLPEEEPTEESDISDELAEAEEAFTELESLMDDEDWKNTIAAISDFQSDYPNYQRRQTERMLYEAYVNLAMELIPGEQVELALFYLAQAEKLGDLPAEAEDYRLWAELYLLGIGYYGVDWETTLYYFRGLCAAAPFYQGSCQKLSDALVAYGDQYAAIMDWCPAEALYFEAAGVTDTVAIRDKMSQARLQCQEATPTPLAPITGTLPLEDSLPAVGDQ